MLMPWAALPADIASLKNVFGLAVPEAVLLAAACVIFLGGTVRAGRSLWAAAALASLGAAAFVFWNQTPVSVAVGVSPLAVDRLSELVRLIAFGGGAIVVALAWHEVPDNRAADFHACLLLLVAGLSLAGSAVDLVSMFLGLELVSIPTYVMLYIPRSTRSTQESALKYFLLSVFSSALLLFGFSYLYGIGGVTNLAALFEMCSSHQVEPSPALLLIAMVMVLAGLGFRITAVPFHFYAPDVFQGAPTSVAALLAFLPKVAGFAALVRVLGYAQGPAINVFGDSQIALLIWLLAAVTMTVGNVLALLQDNLKRILAYSSVAHAGYMLIGLAAAPYLRASAAPGSDGLLGTEAIWFYLVAYGAMTLGAFAVLQVMQSGDRPVATIDDLAGFARTHPALALALTVFVFSLIGLPLTAGFAGKFLLFAGAVSAEQSLLANKGLFIGLAVVGAINAAIGACYYLRLVAAMFLRDAIRPLKLRFQPAPAAAIAVCAVLTIALGVYPTPLIRYARRAAAPVAEAPARPAPATAQR